MRLRISQAVGVLGFGLVVFGVILVLALQSPTNGTGIPAAAVFALAVGGALVLVSIPWQFTENFRGSGQARNPAGPGGLPPK